MSKSDALIESFVRASLGPAATEQQKHLARHSLYVIVREAIAEDRILQQHRSIDKDMARAEELMRGA